MSRSCVVPEVEVGASPALNKISDITHPVGADNCDNFEFRAGML